MFSWLLLLLLQDSEMRNLINCLVSLETLPHKASSSYIYIYILFVYLYFPELPVKNPWLVLSLVALWIYRLSQISFEHCVVQQTLCENEFKNRSFFNRLFCWKLIGCIENFTHVEYAGNVDAQTFFFFGKCV